MSAAADAIRDLLAPALPGWSIQFGRWEEQHGDPRRYAVLKPAGGARAELVRRPQFTLSMIGRDLADRALTSEAADAVVELMRATAGRLVFLQPAEPVFMATDDGRPVFEIALSAITT
jgi:hypothetical protein